MAQKIKLFVQDGPLRTVEDVEAAVNAWLAVNQGLVAIMGIGQSASWKPDGTISVTVTIVYMTEGDHDPTKN